MAGERWSFRKLARVAGLAILSILAYYALLDAISPHPTGGEYQVTSGLPSGEQDQNNRIEIIINYNATPPPEEATYSSYNITEGEISFFELPLWIQLKYLPIAICGAIATFGAAFSVVRRLWKDSDNKRAVMEFVRENPGCTASEVARNNNMNIGTVRYYLQRLGDEGRVAFERMGKYMRVFVNSGAYSDIEKRVAIHMRSRQARSILMAIMESPGISNQRLAETLGMEKSLLYRYTQKLLEDGIITFEWDGTSKRYFIDASAKDALASLSPQSPRRTP